MLERIGVLLKEYDAVLLTSPYNMRYFSGFLGGEGCAVICGGGSFLFTDSRYTEAAEKEAKRFKVIECGGAAKRCALISEIAKKNDIRTMAFEDDFMSYAEFSIMSDGLEGVSLCGASNKINALRIIKSEDEIKKLRRAEEIGILAFENVLKNIREGITERDIAAELEYFMRKNGADGVSFDTIAISGKNTSLPHGMPSGKRLENGDFITMDFGCVYDGYCSDMTRTVVLGKAGEKQKRIYDTVLKAQLCGLEAIRAGVICADADAVARNVIKDAGFGEFFGHSLGHGVGLQIHEMPNLSPKCNIRLEENMIVTCEPGIYIPDFGGVRIEDMVCVKKDGVENFSAGCTKELIEI